MRKIIMKHDKNSKKTFIFSKTIFCHKKISTLQNVTNRFYFRQKIQPESVSSKYYDKSRNGKRFLFANVDYF